MHLVPYEHNYHLDHDEFALPAIILNGHLMRELSVRYNHTWMIHNVLHTAMPYCHLKKKKYNINNMDARYDCLGLCGLGKY